MIPVRLNPRYPFFGMAPDGVVVLPQFLQMYDEMTCFVISHGCGFRISVMIFVCCVACAIFTLPQFEHFSDL